MISTDANRAGRTTEYELGATEPGEWVNYTRTFPAGTWSVTARIADAGIDPFVARLEIVTSDPTQTNQTTTAIGAFLGRNAAAGYSELALTDVVGTPITVTLEGETTLRIAAQTGSFNLNYLTFTPGGTEPTMPTIDITAPSQDTGIAPGNDLEIEFSPGSAATVSAIQLLATSTEGEELTVGESTGGPITWFTVPEGTWSLLAIVADQSGLVGLSSSLRVLSDATPPEFQSARGKSIEDVTLTFSEPLDPATAGDVTNYSIEADGTSLGLLSARVSNDGTVTLATEVQEVGKTYTLTMSNLTDLAGNPLAPGTETTFTGKGLLLQSSIGFVVWEAEDFDRNLDGLWIEDREYLIPSGGVSMVVPNGGGGSEAETKLEYDIKFVKTGTHYLWYRGSGPNGNDDSGWFHLNGDRPPNRTQGNSASMAGINSPAAFVWRSQAQDGGELMSFEINQVGVHTVSLARREDGAYYDKFLITTDPNFDPATEGEFGPPDTPREGQETAAGEVTITENPVDVQTTEHDAFTLTADGTGSEGFILLFQWQRQVDGTFVDIPGATGTEFTVTRSTLDWDGAIVRMTVNTEGAVAASSEATITIIPETVEPEALRAGGREDRITLQFSEPLDRNAAETLDRYTATGNGQSLEVLNARLLANERTVELTTAAQTAGVKYTVAMSGINDQAGNPNTYNGEKKFYSLGGILPQSAEGLLVFEAESFTENTDDLWVVDNIRGTPSGGRSVVLPNGAGGNEESKLNYELTFTQTGRHIIWYRASGPSGTDDSGWLHLDGARPTERADGNMASMTGFSNQEDFVWRSQPQEGEAPMTFELAEAGPHTIGLARREDGSYFDKFVITTDPDFNPEDFGPLGPPETRSGAPALPSLTLIGPEGIVPEGGPALLTASISDTDRVVAKVSYFAAGELIGESTQAPFSFSWTNPPSGSFIVTAILTDDVGDEVRSEAIDVSIDGEGDGTVNVLWISETESPAGAEFGQWITEAGLGFAELFLSDPTAEEQALINTASVVVISRKTNSGTYNNETWDTTITAPLILMTPYLSRSNRWQWLDGDGLVDDTPAVIQVNQPDHPVFNNLPAEDGTVGPWHLPVDRGTSFADEPIANGGTVLATTGDGAIAVAEWPNGTVAAGPRMLFSGGSREPDGATIEEAGKFNLTEEGAGALYNAIVYMAGQRNQPPVTTDVRPLVSVERTANGVLIHMEADRTYDIEYSPNLERGSWTVIETDQTGTYEDTDAARTGNEKGFYRGVAK
ncbi:MAG: Ig-like domain-containing protein [Verrucomicrobiota bacterium]